MLFTDSPMYIKQILIHYYWIYMYIYAYKYLNDYLSLDNAKIRRKDRERTMQVFQYI